MSDGDQPIFSWSPLWSPLCTFRGHIWAAHLATHITALPRAQRPTAGCIEPASPLGQAPSATPPVLRHAKQFRATIVELDRRLADDPEQNAMTRADLHALISRKARVSELFAGKRAPSVAQIRARTGAGDRERSAARLAALRSCRSRASASRKPLADSEVSNQPPPNAPSRTSKARKPT